MAIRCIRFLRLGSIRKAHQVELGFTLENSWASSTAANSARNQTFALTLTTGFNSPATQLTQGSFTQIVFSRWRRSFWIDSAPAPIQINYNWPYLASTAAYANFNPNYTPNESDLEAMYAVYTNEPAGRLTIPGIDQLNGNGGIVNYDESHQRCRLCSLDWTLFAVGCGLPDDR